MTWQPIALLGLLALGVFYAGAYALCLNEGFHNILAYQYGDVTGYCRFWTFYPFSLFL
jgi:hypothetical protein